MQKAKQNGVSKSEIVEILTQLAFYSGWPKAWSGFRLAKDIWASEKDLDAVAKNSIFPIGVPNDDYKQYFIGQSYLAMLTGEGLMIANVTFEPSCRNNWHVQKAEKGGGQILLCTEGEGWYQEWGKLAKRLKVGDVVVIPAGVKHWHGAVKDSWFAHLAIEVPGEKTLTEWFEPVVEVYNDLK